MVALEDVENAESFLRGTVQRKVIIGERMSSNLDQVITNYLFTFSKVFFYFLFILLHMHFWHR